MPANSPDRIILMRFSGVATGEISKLTNSVLNATHHYDPETDRHSHDVYTVKAYVEIGKEEGALAVVMLGMVDDDTADGFGTFQVARKLAEVFPQGIFTPLEQLIKVTSLTPQEERKKTYAV